MYFKAMANTVRHAALWLTQKAHQISVLSLLVGYASIYESEAIMLPSIFKLNTFDAQVGLPASLLNCLSYLLNLIPWSHAFFQAYQVGPLFWLRSPSTNYNSPC